MKTGRDGGAIALGALLVWAAHFFAAYGLALVLPEARVVKPMIIVGTLAALAALAFLSRAVRQCARHQRVGQQSLLLAALAIAWQSLVALF